MALIVGFYYKIVFSLRNYSLSKRTKEEYLVKVSFPGLSLTQFFRQMCGKLKTNWHISQHNLLAESVQEVHCCFQQEVN